MSLQHLQPVNGKHSIRAVVFALEWQTALTVEAVKELATCHPEFKSELPNSKFSRSVTVNISDANKTSTEVGEMTGVMFEDSVDGNAPKNAITITANNCLISLDGGSYTRWAEIWGRVSHYYSVIIPILIKHAKISIYGLQYVDQFIWNGADEDFSPALMFRGDSPYFPSNLLKAKGIWHCHQGFYDMEQHESPITVLNNVNVSCVQPTDKLTLDITMAHRAMLPHALEAFSAEDLLEGGSIGKTMNQLHLSDKEVLKGLLLPEVLSLIGI